MYPITIPNPYWVYLCQVFANANTPIMLSVASTGVVNLPGDMSELGKEVSFNIPNSLNDSFFTWINLQTNVVSPSAINTFADVSNTVYPAPIPDPAWLYICLLYTSRCV